MCGMHWQRWRRWGDPRRVDGRWKQSELERFWSKVDKRGPDECWPWTGGTKRGYGAFYVWDGQEDRLVQAHRYSYELANGRIPGGLHLDHLCHTASISWCQVAAACPHRSCVNPAHLEPVTKAENSRRGSAGAKTHCKWGHEYTPENTGRNGKMNTRYCRICARASGARIRARKRQQA